MTLNDMLTQLENWLQTTLSPQTGKWSQAQAINEIHDGHMKLFTLVANQAENFFSKQSTVSEVANTATVSLPTDLYRLLSVERVLSSTGTAIAPLYLDRIDRNRGSIESARGSFPWENSSSVTTGTPIGFYANGQKELVLIPTPSGSLTNSLRITYIQRPAKMTVTTSVPFQSPEGVGGAGTDNLTEFHDIIALYAVESMFMKEESFNQASFYTARRQEREHGLTNFLRSINAQGPRYAHYTGNWE